MRIPSLLIASLFMLGIAAGDADAAKRFGGGGNTGKQRAVPTKSEAVPASTPAKPAPTAPAATPATPPPKPSFMSRWGGLLVGLGVGALLASMFGAQMGPIVGMLLAVALVAGLGFLAYRFFASRGNPAAKPLGLAGAGASPVASPGFSGIGSGVPAAGLAAAGNVPESALTPDTDPSPAKLQPNFDVETFLRGARTTFIRLQAANDAKDLDDIREYTTTEMYAEIAMQARERGNEPQKTEVVTLNAQLVDVAVEDGYDIASVRFTGLIREQDAGNPEPFDEVWHVRKKIGDRNPAWLISGIQQIPQQEAA
jgi:predicted lipid-binding transport protein (Tim44 family)